MRSLHILSKTLRSLGFEKYAQEVDGLAEPEEWDEDWHESAVENLETEERKRLEESALYLDKDKMNPAGSYVSGLDYEILSKHGLIPIEADGEAYLGNGRYGTVYNVIWNGKPAAAKLTMDDESDANIWDKILAATKSPQMESVANIFPEVYEVIRSHESSDLFSDFDSPTYSIIVMEKLYPLPKEVAKVWGGPGKVPRLGQSNVEYRDIYREDAISAEIQKSLAELLPGRSIELELPTIEELEIEASRYETRSEIIGTMASSILNIIYEKNKIIEDDYSLREPVWYGVSDYVGKLKPYLKREDNYRGVPDYYNIMEDDIEEVRKEVPPEHLGVFDQLLKLQRMSGIRWHDLHSKNVMIDADGNIKVTDVGNFNVVENEETARTN